MRKIKYMRYFLNHVWLEVAETYIDFVILYDIIRRHYWRISFFFRKYISSKKVKS
jgi:hypothetical protein